jgi:spermidine synthase
MYKKTPINFLKFSVFVTGAVVMALEIIASRLMAPVFGDSVYIWGSLIGVIMAALAFGYYVGGKMADTNPNFQTFSLTIFAAGVLTLVIPFDSPFILEITSGIGFGERYGPIIATLLLLAAPTTLLGILSPYAVRLATESLSSVGGTSGSLYSISTGGSIFGTFFTVFFLVPTIGVRTIIFSLGLILIALSLLGLTRMEKFFAILLAILVTMPSGSILSGALSSYSGTVIYQKDTPYNSLMVVDYLDTGKRILWMNSLPHSAMYLNGSSNSAFLYTDYFNVAFAFSSDIKRVLFVGGGGYSGPKNFFFDYPEVKIDVVEIDATVVDVAKEYFRVPDDPRLRSYVDDGRAFLTKTNELYDLIVLDAYSKSHVPFHLMTEEFFKLVDKHLAKGGLVVSNLISSLIGDTSDLLRAEYKTVTLVLPQAYLFRTKSSSLSTIQNIILVATKTDNRYSIQTLEENIAESTNRPEVLTSYVSNLYDESIRIDDIPVLTDNYAPTENLLNPVTGAPYEGGEEQLPRSSVNYLLIAGAWTAALVSVYYTSNAIKKTMSSRVPKSS